MNTIVFRNIKKNFKPSIFIQALSLSISKSQESNVKICQLNQLNRSNKSNRFFDNSSESKIQSQPYVYTKQLTKPIDLDKHGYGVIKYKVYGDKFYLSDKYEG